MQFVGSDCILLTDTRIAVGVFFQLLNIVVVSVVWVLFRAYFRISFACRRQTHLHGNT